MPDHALARNAAAILAERQQQGIAGPRLPECCRPTDNEAGLAIQEETVRLLGVRTGAHIGGWKCGTPAPGKLVVAPILDRMIYHASPCKVPLQEGMVRVEPELAFIIGRDLPARTTPYAPNEIDDAIGEVRLALELIHSRYAQPEQVPFAEHLADRLLNLGLYLGPRVTTAARSAGSLTLSVNAGDGEQRIEGRHPDGDPLLPLYWLADFLRTRGRGLKAGEAVITGSYVPSFELPAGRDLSLRFGELGLLEVRFDL